MSDNTVGSMYLAASERNAQRIADLQAEVERLRADNAELEAYVKDQEWCNETRSQYIAERDATIDVLRAQITKLEAELIVLSHELVSTDNADRYYRGFNAGYDHAEALAKERIAERDEWEPVPNGAYHTDGAQLIEVQDARLKVYDTYNAEADLPMGLALCRRKAKE